MRILEQIPARNPFPPVFTRLTRVFYNTATPQPSFPNFSSHFSVVYIPLYKLSSTASSPRSHNAHLAHVLALACIFAFLPLVAPLVFFSSTFFRFVQSRCKRKSTGRRCRREVTNVLPDGGVVQLRLDYFSPLKNLCLRKRPATTS